jgi:uncharacterized protein (TIGR01777 family)
MKVLITGATGLIGRELCAALSARGDDVVALTRNAAKARNVLGAAKIFEWNPLAGTAPIPAFDGVDAVVNLLGETVGQRWNPAVKARIRESRIAGTHNLVETLKLLDKKPRVLICGSAVGFYGDRGDEQLSEASSAGSDFLAQVCRDWEAEGQRAADLALRVVLLRTGLVLNPDGGALQQMLCPFRLGLGGRLGHGRQWLPWIHRDDMTALILHAIDRQSLSGPLNATAPNPVTNADFARELGAALHRPAIFPVPAFTMRLKFGEFTDAALLASQRALPRAALDSGFRFAHPHLADALAHLLGRSEKRHNQKGATHAACA